MNTNNKNPQKNNFILPIIALILALYLAYLLAACYTPGSTPIDILAVFSKYVIGQRHFLVGITPATPVCLVAAAIIWLMWFATWSTKIKNPYAGKEFGNAKWGDPIKFTRKYADRNWRCLLRLANKKPREARQPTGKQAHVPQNRPDNKIQPPVTPELPSGLNRWIAEDTFFSVQNGTKRTFGDVTLSNINHLVIGPSGSRKTISVAKPVLYSGIGAPDRRDGCNFIITDPKADMYPQTASYCANQGCEVFILDIRYLATMTRFSHYNPYRYIFDDGDLHGLAAIIYDAASKVEDEYGGKFWNDSAKELLTALNYLVHYHYPKEYQDWRAFADLMDAMEIVAGDNGRIDAENCRLYRIALEANMEWKETHGENATFPGFRTISNLYNGAYETSAGIIKTLQTRTKDMLLPEVAELLSGDDIDLLNTFGRSRPSTASPAGKYVLYLCTNQGDHTYDWIMNMFYAQLLKILYRVASLEFHGSLPVHTTFLMDECANIVLPENFTNLLSTVRSYNISVIMIYQNMKQVKKQFPKYDEDEVLRGMCQIVQILGSLTPEEADILSKLFGDRTEYKRSVTRQRKGLFGYTETIGNEPIRMPLLSPQTIANFTDSAEQGICAIYIKDNDPLYVKKVETWRHPALYAAMCTQKEYLDHQDHSCHR